jgi:hypothetical protein
MAFEPECLAAADAVHELVGIMIAARTAALSAMALVVPIGVTLAARTVIGTIAMIAALTAAAVAIAATAAPIAAATAVTVATAILGERRLPAKRHLLSTDAYRQCGQHEREGAGQQQLVQSHTSPDLGSR